MKKYRLFFLLILVTPMAFIWSKSCDVSFLTNHISQQKADNITATITKDNTNKQLEELVAYFKENDITVSLEDIRRNTNNEITGIAITIEKNQQQSSMRSNSSAPIRDLELGYKNGNVFIGNSSTDTLGFGGDSLQSLLQQSFGAINNSEIDSLLSKNQFSFSFGSEDIRKLLKDSNFDFNDIQNQFFNHFFNDEDNTNPSSNLSKSANKNTLPKYQFFGSSHKNKLIIIDGKEANFKQLEKLAATDSIEELDNLKPSTAESIYGKKGVNGAIIASTKK